MANCSDPQRLQWRGRAGFSPASQKHQTRCLYVRPTVIVKSHKAGQGPMSLTECGVRISRIRGTQMSSRSLLLHSICRTARPELSRSSGLQDQARRQFEPVKVAARSRIRQRAIRLRQRSDRRQSMIRWSFTRSSIDNFHQTNLDSATWTFTSVSSATATSRCVSIGSSCS